MFVICFSRFKTQCEMVTLCLFQCPTSIMGSAWWTARPWSVSRPSASPQRPHPFSAWPGFLLRRACSSQEVKPPRTGKRQSPSLIKALRRFETLKLRSSLRRSRFLKHGPRPSFCQRILISYSSSCCSGNRLVADNGDLCVLVGQTLRWES